jgi:hypothetical protein
MRMSALACLAACAVAWGAPAARFDFKGVVIGEPATPEDIQQKLGLKCGLGAFSFQVCNGRGTIAGEPSDINLVIGADGIVRRIRVSFNAKSFSDVASAVLAKLGKPTKTTREVTQNRMGASFLNVTHYWVDASRAEVVLTQNAGSLDESLLMFSTEAERKMREDLQKKKASDL